MTGGDSSGNGADWRLNPDPSDVERYSLRPHSPDDWVVGELREPEPEPVPATPPERPAPVNGAAAPDPVPDPPAPAPAEPATVAVAPTPPPPAEPPPVVVLESPEPTPARANRFLERVERVDARLSITEEKVASSLRRTSRYARRGGANGPVG